MEANTTDIAQSITFSFRGLNERKRFQMIIKKGKCNKKKK